MRVLSNPIKNNKSFLVLNVIISASKMKVHSVINIRFFFFLLFWRCPILANRETGSSQNLSMIRGVLMVSFFSPQFIFDFNDVGDISNILYKKINEDLEIVKFHIFMVGVVHVDRRIPITRKIKVNIITFLIFGSF